MTKSNFVEQNIYNQILENMPIPCVDVVILHNNSVLLVKRKDKPAQGEWWVPGGRVLKGETMKQTAKRKASEEVGIDCVVGPIIHTAETIFPDGERDIPVHSINSCFFLVPQNYDGKVELDEHCLEYTWVDDISTAYLHLHPYVLDCIRSVL